MLADGRPKISLALISGLLLVLLSGAVAFWLSNEQRLADGWVRHTLQVENRLNHAQVITARAEIQRRGFLLNGDVQAVRLYRALRREVLPEFDAIVEAVVDNPAQVFRARALRSTAIAKLDEMALSIRLVQHGRTATAIAVMSRAESRASTARLLDILDQMRAAEQDLLTRRQARAARLAGAGELALAACAALVVILSLLVAHDRRRRMLALAKVNRELEEDIAERKALERELDQARIRAEDAGQAKANFLAQMSHEIRTPMNGVIGFTRLLLEGELSETQRRHTELIADSGRAMMRLLNDILDLSKIEAGHLVVSSEPFDLPHAIRACSKLMAPAVQQKQLTSDCQISPEVPTMLVGDGLRLRQILVNLLANAVKFTAEGTVLIRAGTDGREVRIEVVDTGIEIAPDRQAAIFDRFVQAGDDIAPRYGGTGLGLSISAQLAGLMGGRLEVESALGKGSCFALIIPVRLPAALPSTQVSKAIKPMAPAPTRAPALNILVAEDHDVNQLLIAELLERSGHRATIVGDGAAALVEVGRAAEAGSPYDLVLMDMQMPVMDGLEAAKRLRAGFDAATLPIVALTANAYAEDVAACLRAGMQAHLGKPLDPADLAAAIHRWVPPRGRPAAPNVAQFSPRIRERYAARRAELLERVAAMARCDGLRDGDAAALGEMLHKFLGSAAMFGDHGFAAEARKLEAALDGGAREQRLPAVRNAAAAMARAA